jgi:hypothetical protein
MSITDEMPVRKVTMRRALEQIYHCAREALSVLENREHESAAIDDLEQAQAMIGDVLPQLRVLAGGGKVKLPSAEPCVDPNCDLLEDHAGPHSFRLGPPK